MQCPLKDSCNAMTMSPRRADFRHFRGEPPLRTHACTTVRFRQFLRAGWGVQFLRRSGGMRGSGGTIYGGGKNRLRSKAYIYIYMQKSYALIMQSYKGILAWYCLARRFTAPQGGWRRIASPKGEHRRPPAFFFTALWGNLFLALVDVCDLGNMDMSKRG